MGNPDETARDFQRHAEQTLPPLIAKLSDELGLSEEDGDRVSDVVYRAYSIGLERGQVEMVAKVIEQGGEVNIDSGSAGTDDEERPD